MNTTNSDFDFFNNELPNFLKEHKGQFVLIKDKKIIGFYPTAEDALKSAYEHFGNQDFLIQEITDENRVNYINSTFLPVGHQWV